MTRRPAHHCGRRLRPLSSAAGGGRRRAARHGALAVTAPNDGDGGAASRVPVRYRRRVTGRTPPTAVVGARTADGERGAWRAHSPRYYVLCEPREYRAKRHGGERETTSDGCVDKNVVGVQKKNRAIKTTTTNENTTLPHRCVAEPSRSSAVGSADGRGRVTGARSIRAKGPPCGRQTTAAPPFSARLRQSAHDQL